MGGGEQKDTDRGGWDRRGDGEIVNDVEGKEEGQMYNDMETGKRGDG